MQTAYSTWRVAALFTATIAGFGAAAPQDRPPEPSPPQPTSAPAPTPQTTPIPDRPPAFICGTPPTAGASRSFNNRAWPAGMVPFEFVDEITQDERDHMLASMDLWGNEAGVHFVNRGSQADFITVRRSLQEGVSLSSEIGRHRGEQFLRIWDSHWNNHPVVAHELCHALGFHHEHQRPDRDEFVTIHFENVVENEEDQFAIQPNDVTTTPYDYESIMHYWACAFSRCQLCLPVDPACRTITTADPFYQVLIGIPLALSASDKEDMRAVYGPRRARYVTRGASGVGTLSEPLGTIADGLAAIPDGGLLLLGDSGGSYPNTGIFRQRSEWRANGASAVIGR